MMTRKSDESDFEKSKSQTRQTAPDQFEHKDSFTTKEKEVSLRELVDLPSTTYGAFSLYRYPAKFIPHVVAYVLENYASPDMRVFDSFGGYGTTGVVSQLYGNDYEL